MKHNHKNLQFVYLDFDGAETSYSSELLSLENVTVTSSGFTASQAAEITEILNEKYEGSVVFVTQKPESEEFSTVYIGKTDAFAEYGEFSGLAEAIDKDNQNMSDNAFVMLNAAAGIDTAVEVISHEVEHIVFGMAHPETNNTLADLAYSSSPVKKTIGGINPSIYDQITEAIWDASAVDKPGEAVYGSITGSTEADVISFAADKSRWIEGNIDLGSGNDKIVLLASQDYWEDDAEVTVRKIYMGSGNDVIELQRNTELECDYWSADSPFTVDMGTGDDKVIVRNGGDWDLNGLNMGSGNNTFEINGNADLNIIVFGSGNDTVKLSGKGSSFDVSGYYDYDGKNACAIDFGGGNDTLNIGSGSILETQGNLYFGTGTDTLVLNGGLFFSSFFGSQTINIDSLEKISGSGWIGFSSSDNLSESTLNRFKNCGIKIYNAYGADGEEFKGPAELDDNSRSNARTLVSDDDEDFWLSGKTFASKHKNVLADTTDWFKFEKYGETEIDIDYGYTSGSNDVSLGKVTAKLYDSKGNYVTTLGKNGGDISSRANGTYYLQLTVGSSSISWGEIEIETETKKPDLVVSSCYVSSSTISPNGSVKLTFKIANEGGTKAGSSKVKIYDGNTLLKTVSVSSLSAGKSKSYSVTLKGSQLGGGKSSIYVCADSGKQVSEANEVNNMRYCSVTVKSADLTVKDCKVSYSTIASNSSTTLSFKIANIGAYTAGASKVKIYDGSRLLKTLSVSSLSVNSSKSFSVNLSGSTLGLGKNTIYVVADAENQVSEYSSSNNKVSKTVTVKKIADLTVKDCKVSYSGFSYNSSTTLSFKIANDGEYTAGASKVKIYDGSRVIQTLSVDSIAAKSSRSYSVTIKGSTLGLGKNTLYVVADADSQVYEYSNSNNKVSKSVTVKRPADLAVQDCKLSYSTCSYNGGTTLKFKIANIGEYTAGASKVKIYDGDTLLKTISLSSFSAKSSRSYSVSLKGSSLGLGKSTLYVVADADNQVSEYSSSNNKVSKSVTVKKNADLAVTDCKLSYSTCSYKGSTTLSFKIANEGEYTAGSSKVKIYDGSKLLQTLSLSSISAKSSRSYSVSLKGSTLGLGTSTIYVVADAENKVSEYSSSNNKVSTTVTVKKNADLVVKDCKVNYSTISTCGSVTLSFKIANDGEYSAGASTVKIYDGSRVIKTLSVDSISAKSSRSYSVSFKGSILGTGKNTLYVAADAESKISEYSESNNKVSKTVTVTKSTDLCVKDLKVSSSTISADGSVKLTFKIANVGEYGAGSSKVKIYDGDTLLKTLSVNSLSIGKSQSFTVTLSAGELAGLGERKLCVEADGNKQFAELSESNNTSFCTVDITGGTPDWLSAGFGDYGEADGFEDMLVSSKDLNLSSALGSDDEYISGLAAALGEDWTFAGVADWNGDGSLEVLFCGSELSQRPEVDENNKLLITLA